MKHYVLATQQPWGVKAFETWRNDRCWAIAQHQDALAVVLRQLRPRFVFFVNWSVIVSPNVLALTECVNFHSFGPAAGVWHRGGAPIENLLLRGYTETMIGAHRMTSDVDAGDIYGMRGPISLSGTKDEILDRFVVPVCDLIRWIVAEEPEPSPQVGEVVLFTRLPKADMAALWLSRQSDEK